MEYIGVIVLFLVIYYIALQWYKLRRKGKIIENIILLLVSVIWLLKGKTLYSGIMILVLFIWVFGARILLYLKPKFDYLLYNMFDKKKGYLFEEYRPTDFEEKRLVVNYYIVEIFIVLLYFCMV